MFCQVSSRASCASLASACCSCFESAGAVVWAQIPDGIEIKNAIAANETNDIDIKDQQERMTKIPTMDVACENMVQKIDQPQGTKTGRRYSRDQFSKSLIELPVPVSEFVSFDSECDSLHWPEENVGLSTI